MPEPLRRGMIMAPTCPKCGRPEASLRYCNGSQKYRLVGDTCTPTVQRDHFHHQCGRCSYSWMSYEMAKIQEDR